MDSSLPGSAVHGIFQTRILTRVGCHFLLQRIFPTQGSNRCFTVWATREPPPKKISTCVQKKISTRASVVPLKTSQSLRRLKFFHHMHHTVVDIRKCKWPLTTLILLKQREECKERSNSISIVFDSENESGHKNVVFSQTHQKLVVASMFQKQLADLHC